MAPKASVAQARVVQAPKLQQGTADSKTKDCAAAGFEPAMSSILVQNLAL